MDIEEENRNQEQEAETTAEQENTDGSQEQIPHEPEADSGDINRTNGNNNTDKHHHENPKERAEFYRSLLVQIMGFGMAVIVVICVAVMAAGDTELFSLEDPNQVAMEAARLKGTPDSNDYKIEFRNEKHLANNRRTSAVTYFCVIGGGTIFWLIAIIWIWVQYRRICGKKPAMCGGLVLGYCILLAATQFLLGYFLLDVDEHGRNFFCLLMKAFSGK